MNKEKFQKKDEKFDKLYNQIYSETYKELSDSLKPLKIKILLIVVFFTILDVLLVSSSPATIPLSILIVFALIILIYNKNTQKYRHIYKTKVLQRFIQLYDKNLNYNPEKGLPNTIYNDAEFEKYDKYSSKDLIYGDLDTYEIKMSQICTEKITIASDGSSQYTSLFIGLFAVSTFENNFNGTIKVRTDRGKLLNTFHKKNKLEMDSQEFEKYFDVISTNNLQAMQVLTSDIMNMLIDFEQTCKMKIELTIKKHKIFIRFHSKTFLKPPLFSVINYKTLLKDYNLINFTFDISKALIKTTAETKI